MEFQRAHGLIAALLSIACLAGIAAQTEKPVLAVLDLRTKDISREEMLGVVDSLTAAFFKTGSFTVIDRSARDALLGEIEFSLTGAADADSQKEMGRHLAADLVVSGSMGRYQDGRCVLSLRMLETESAVVLGVQEDLFADFDAMIESLESQARSLVKSARISKAGERFAITVPESEPSGDIFAPLPDRESFPFQLSIFAPLQLVPPKTAIVGLRLGIGYSDNVAVSGLDIGIVNNVQGTMSGVQTGLVGFAGEVLILQMNLVFNNAQIVRGSQIGVVNIAEKCAGLQLGVVNIAGLLRGVQIGLVNIIRYGEGSQFMPFINFSL